MGRGSHCPLKFYLRDGTGADKVPNLDLSSRFPQLGLPSVNKWRAIYAQRKVSCSFHMIDCNEDSSVSHTPAPSLKYMKGAVSNNPLR